MKKYLLIDSITQQPLLIMEDFTFEEVDEYIGSNPEIFKQDVFVLQLDCISKHSLKERTWN